MTDKDNPILFGTEKDYAWNAWQKAFDAGKLLPSRERFDAWWRDVALVVSWPHIKNLLDAAWKAGVMDRSAQGYSGFNSWWQEILDKQPVIT